jgi:hypothetical protein
VSVVWFAVGVLVGGLGGVLVTACAVVASEIGRADRAPDRWVSDGSGNCWVRCGDADCDLHVVRPGVAVCHGDEDGTCGW